VVKDLTDADGADLVLEQTTRRKLLTVRCCFKKAPVVKICP